ncbi:MAG: hypothetical protein ACLFQB_12190 [Chitinispirillaceae bacterium]
MAVLTGCQESSTIGPDGSIDRNENENDVMRGTGEVKKLENPYTVATMKKARDNLVEKGVLNSNAVTDEDIATTHLYIRFKPANEEEFIKLNDDSSLVLWDHPLDYEIPEGSRYALSKDFAGYLYTAVPVEQKLPDVEYEILDELVLERGLESLELAKSQVSSYYPLLEKEALEMTGNLKTEPGLKKTMGKWRPTGSVKVYDDVLGEYVPVVSVNVRVRNWFRWWNGYTDINGNFRSSTRYWGDVAYSLRWQYIDNKFDIRSGTVGQAYYNGPNQKRSAWNLRIGKGGMSWTYAHIYRAGSYYIGQEPFGLNNTPFKRVSIMAINGRTPSDKSGYYIGFNENIKIWRKWSSGSLINSKDIFTITTHELGHAHHDEIYEGGSFVTNVDSYVKESWASAVSYYLTSSVYNIPISYSSSWYTRQAWKAGSGNYYTPIMIDLIDNHDQSSRSSSYLKDDISGYTLKQCQDIIKKGNCKNLTKFMNYIWNLPLPSGVTKAKLYDYLAQYGFKKPYAILFEHDYYRGDQLRIFENVDNLVYERMASGWSWNDQITSIKLVNGASLKVYEHDYFRGAEKSFSSSVGNLFYEKMPDGTRWNDQITSIVFN